MFTKEVKSETKNPICGMAVNETIALRAERDGNRKRFAASKNEPVIGL
jgi:hypothetical protein